MNVVIETQITGQRNLKELNCKGITLHTNELSTKQKLDLDSLHNQHVITVFSDAPFNNDLLDAVKSYKASPDEKYTPSQRLRFAIIDWAQRRGEDKEKWNEFYSNKIELLIDYVNEKDK